MKLIKPVVFGLLSVVCSVSAYAEELDVDAVVSESDEICRNVRSMRLKDFDKASEIFMKFEKEMKHSLMNVESTFVTSQGLGTSSVQRLCQRVAESMSRGMALKILDSALLSCEKASQLRKEGRLSDATSEHMKYEDLIEEARGISEEALTLHPSALQFQHCSRVGNNIDQGINKRAKDTLALIRNELNACKSSESSLVSGTWSGDLSTLSQHATSIVKRAKHATQVSSRSNGILNQEQKTQLATWKTELGQCAASLSGLVKGIDESPVRQQTQKLIAICKKAEELQKAKSSGYVAKSRNLYNQLKQEKATLSVIQEEGQSVDNVHVSAWLDSQKGKIESCELKLKKSFESQWDLPEEDIQFDVDSPELEDLDDLIQGLDGEL